MKSASSTLKTDVYTRITNRIIADLEKGTRPWLKPWNIGNMGSVTRPLRHNGAPYQGINILLLWADAMDKGFQYLDDLQAGREYRGACPQRRKWLLGRLC